MKDTDQQNAEFSDKDVTRYINQHEKNFLDEEEVLITDLETPATTRDQRTLCFTKLVVKGITTPWIRYSLTGLLILVLLFTLLRQFPSPAFPTTAQQNTPSTPITRATSAFYPLSPVLGGDRVFMQSINNILNAFETTTGHQIWQKPLPAPAQLATAGNLLFYYYVKSSQQGVLAALNGATGQTVWLHTLAVSLPLSLGEGPGFLLSDNTLYTVDASGTLFAWRASDGQLRWSRSVGPAAQKLSLNDAIYAGNGVVEMNSPDDHTVIICNAADGRQVARLAVRKYGPPLPIAVDKQFIYVLPGPDYQSIGQNIQVLHISNGASLWTRTFPEGIGLIQEHDGMIYFSNVDHSSFSALRASDGHQLWSYRTDNGEAITSLYFDPRGIIYLLQQDAILVSLRASDGHILWRDETIPVMHSVVGNPQIAVDQNTLFIYNDFTLSDTQNIPIAAFSTSDGHLIWRALASPGKLQPRAGILYLLFGQEIDAWSETTGQFLWSYQASATLSIVGTLPNVVLFIDQTGRLGAFNTGNGKPLWFYSGSILESN